jgi:hypothetical protein
MILPHTGHLATVLDISVAQIGHFILFTPPQYLYIYLLFTNHVHGNLFLSKKTASRSAYRASLMLEKLQLAAILLFFRPFSFASQRFHCFAKLFTLYVYYIQADDSCQTYNRRQI